MFVLPLHFKHSQNVHSHHEHFYAQAALSDDAVWRLSVAYIRRKSRTERPRKTKIGTEVAHVTWTPLSRSKCQRLRSPGHFGWLYWHANMNTELVTDPYTCMMYIVSPLAGLGRGILWQPPAYSLLLFNLTPTKFKQQYWQKQIPNKYCNKTSFAFASNAGYCYMHIYNYKHIQTLMSTGLC